MREKNNDEPKERAIEVVITRRPRGRPPGSKNKPKPPIFTLFALHLIETILRIGEVCRWGDRCGILRKVAAMNEGVLRKGEDRGTCGGSFHRRS
ncbi:hypothetical protein SESBI_44113 [Sesbania bispinosa]|nr:hypothetical protein SESBI_44113 [Sesbania bispinosa]